MPKDAGLEWHGRQPASVHILEHLVKAGMMLMCREAVERAVPVVLSAEKRASLVSLQDRLQVGLSHAAAG